MKINIFNYTNSKVMRLRPMGKFPNGEIPQKT